MACCATTKDPETPPPVAEEVPDLDKFSRTQSEVERTKEGVEHGYEDPNHGRFGLTGCTWNCMKDWSGDHCISVETLLAEAQTGDVILFDNQLNLGTCLIKCVTRSDFDHVGVVVRFPEPAGVRLLEAVAPRILMDKLETVATMVESGRMFYRKLRRKDGAPTFTPEQEKEVQEYAMEFMGRPYENNLKEMVQAWHTGEGVWWSEQMGCDCTLRYVKEDEHKKMEPDTEKAMFCSECVAAIYRKIGLIDSSISAYNFLPKDFSSDPHASLRIEDEYELIDERKIIHGDNNPYTNDNGGRPQTFLV